MAPQTASYVPLFFNEKPAPEWRNNVGSFLAFHMNFRQDRRENSCIPPAKFQPKAELGGGTICAGGAGRLCEIQSHNLKVTSKQN